MDECTDYNCAFAPACRKYNNIVSVETIEEVAKNVAGKKYEDMKKGGYGPQYKTQLVKNPEELKRLVHQIQEREGSEKCFVL